MVKEMNRLRRVAIPIGRFGLRIAAATLLFASCAFAQFGPPASSPGGSQASQLPLSGRTGQTGGATATQTTVPGTTTSVDTLNPSIQVQGPYAGSANSTRAMPFSGKLGLTRSHSTRAGIQLGRNRSDASVAPGEGDGPRGTQRVAPQRVAEHYRERTKPKIWRRLACTSRFRASALPTVVGPFDYLDVRANLTQTILDLTALNNYRSANEISRADQLSALDAKDSWFWPSPEPIFKCLQRKPESTRRKLNWTQPTPSISKLCSSAMSAWSPKSMPIEVRSRR